MSITQHAPGFDRRWENVADSERSSDIRFGRPCFSTGRSGTVESCDRPVNSVELIRQFLTFLFKHAAYPIHFDHRHPDGSSSLPRARYTSPIPPLADEGGHAQWPSREPISSAMIYG